MKKNYILLLLLTLFATTAQAQLNGDGFYRVKNVKTARYISVIDNRGSIDKSSTQADLGAIQTVKHFDNVANDPGSVIYIKKMGSEYDLVTQGTSVYDMVGITIQIINRGNNIYRAYKSMSGVSRYLFDLDNVNREVGKVLTTGQLTSGTADWYIIPINNEDEHYLAVKPDLKVGDKYYTTTYTSYAYSFNNTADKAYYIKTLDKEVAVLAEVTGDVPANTPVLICAGSDVMAEHKVTPKYNSPAAIEGNKLSGTFFSSTVAGHVNNIPYNASTMRVLGQLSDGTLGFVKAESLEYIPHNTAYLTVPASAPAEIKIMNEEEYAAWKEEEKFRAPVTIAAVNLTREYGEDNPELSYTVSGSLVSGAPVLSCAATATSPVGTYPIVVEKGDIANYTPTLVNGTLTITKAPLKVKVGNGTREYGDANPEFEVTYEGFKNADTFYALRTRPEVQTEATATSTVGEYVVTATGAEAQNYDISYESGTLKVTRAPLVISAGSYSREQGKENPEVTPIYRGFKNRETADVLTKQPVITINADIDSPVGVYDIIVSGAQSPNYSISYVNGTLEVTVSAGISSTNASATAHDIYSLQGTRVNRTTTSLKRGLYIVNGKKVLMP